MCARLHDAKSIRLLFIVTAVRAPEPQNPLRKTLFVIRSSLLAHDLLEKVSVISLHSFQTNCLLYYL